MPVTEGAFQWIRLADADDPVVAENDIRSLTAGHHKFCITRREDKLYAFSHKCPHAGGPLAEGYIDSRGNIVCPLHRYKFSLKNGSNTSGEGFYLHTYPIETREGGHYIGIRKTSFWNLFKT